MNSITGTKKLNDDDLPQLLALPIATAADYVNKSVELDTLSYESLNENEKDALKVASLGMDKTNIDGIFSKRERVNTKLEMDDVEIRTKYPETKSKKGKLSKKRIQAVTSKVLGIAGIKQIPLPHSGFWITVDVIPNINRLVLEQKLAAMELDITITTSTLIYSSPRALYIKTIISFLSEYIIDSSLALDDDDDIMDFINVLDVDILILEVLKTYHVNGLKIAMACKNTLEMNDKGDSINCNYAIEGKLDLEEVYIYDEEALSIGQLTILSRRDSASVSKEEYTEYNSNISDIFRKKEFTYELPGGTIRIELTLSTINRFLELSDVYINEIGTHVDNILMGEENPVVRKTKIEELSKDMLLAKYIHMISSVDINGEIATDVESIYRSLSVMMDDSELIKKVMNNIIEFTNDNLIGMICTPVYTCPNCRKANISEDQEQPEPFQDMIPLDILDVFTELRTKL